MKMTNKCYAINIEFCIIKFLFKISEILLLETYFASKSADAILLHNNSFYYCQCQWVEADQTVPLHYLMPLLTYADVVIHK